MSEKQEIIKQMLEMQRKFIDLEQKGEFSAEEYYDSDGETDLIKLVDMAHEEKGSHR
jgi:hypothetical protein